MYRTFRSQTRKTTREEEAKEKEKVGEKEKDTSDSGHSFGTSAFLHPALCPQCSTSLNTRDALTCTSKSLA